MNGLHLIGDLSNCRCDPLRLLDSTNFKNKCIDMVQAAGLTVMDATFKQFDDSGFTGTVVLAESHLAIHTWPENNGLTLDVYVCNYSADNSSKAHKLFDAIIEYFQPVEIARHKIERGEHTLVEPLNDATGFYITASHQIGEWHTKYQKLSIYDTPHYGKIFRLDDFNMTSEREEFIYHENLIHPALTILDAPKNVLIIGGGDGGSSEEALKHPSVEQVTMVEIDEDVISIAKEHFQAVHNGAFDDPRLRVVVDNGVRFIHETQEKFDLIALDLNDPIGPAAALYSADFFRQCRQALKPDGLMTLHIGSPTAHPARVAEISQRLTHVFQIVRPYTVYIPLYGALWALAVCSDKLDPKAFTPKEIDNRIESRNLQQLQFYNGDAHSGVFALPNYVRKLVAGHKDIAQ
ncbi:spermidine synthase [Nitrosomonas sp. Nm51]|uniref:polyamine aminopropyltransferase n=1 Tax=Nitrosomonas sp. Nm51 TaxID=133720 RepID=UPI0008AB4E62|nr:polyamine aminopropyltransferase [Nitrosomonas sp. Nm51]SER44850.1 spermidine synthase [Nitrosomonas sp. Nm51]